MALRTTICVYAWCTSCKKVHLYPAHCFVDDSELPRTCSDCGHELEWNEFHHHNFPKPGAMGKKKGFSSWAKGYTPVEGFELCLLMFVLLLMALVSFYFFFGISKWTPLWRWISIAGASVSMIILWLLERHLMQQITDGFQRRNLEEGRLQGRYIVLKEEETKEE